MRDVPLASRGRLLFRLIARPLAREPVRTAITTICVAIGVAVVVAIDLAGDASAGSFRSSMESLQGAAGYEVTQVGGLPDPVFGELSRLSVPLRFSARVEGYASVPATGERLPVLGLDLLANESLRSENWIDAPDLGALLRSRPVWLSGSLGAKPGERIELAVNDRLEWFDVQGILGGSAWEGGAGGRLVVMDIALAQRILDQPGKIDRILVEAPSNDERDWQAVVQAHVPTGAQVRPVGARTREHRKLLRSFRWNLQVLSYIALIVGAFLVYNTVSVSVVRRRPLIGVGRAMGMTSRMIRAGFLAEGCFFGVAGTFIGLGLGRALAAGAVGLMGRTVDSLYISSAPGTIEIGPQTALLAVASGLGVSIASSWWPAREASLIQPREALDVARRDYETDSARALWTLGALASAVLSVGLCFVPAVDRVPYAGFAAALGFILAAAMLAPAIASACLRGASRPLGWLFGVEAMIGSRGLASALGRTSVVIAALSTATAMMVSVGIMVGSLRDTLLVWMDNQLQADLYVQAEASAGVENPPTFAEEAATAIEALPEVEDVERFRRYPISYQGLPATLAITDFEVHRRHSHLQFLGRPELTPLMDRLTTTDSVIVSESFSSKHGVDVGDAISLPIGTGAEEFEVAAVYFDYSAEQGYVIGHRNLLMKYLPDERLTSIAIYLADGTEAEEARASVRRSLAGRNLAISRNREIRQRATVIFDRTFAITYALEAVAVFVAILGMAGALLTLVLDRRKEFGVLRALGATQRQVKRLVLTQAGMLGLVSNLLGCALGAVLAVVLIKVINKQSFGWTIQFHWPVGLLLGAVSLILAASFVAGLIPARLAAENDAVNAIHGE